MQVSHVSVAANDHIKPRIVIPGSHSSPWIQKIPLLPLRFALCSPLIGYIIIVTSCKIQKVVLSSGYDDEMRDVKRQGHHDYVFSCHFAIFVGWQISSLVTALYSPATLLVDRSLLARNKKVSVHCHHRQTIWIRTLSSDECRIRKAECTCRTHFL